MSTILGCCPAFGVPRILIYLRSSWTSCLVSCSFKGNRHKIYYEWNRVLSTKRQNKFGFGAYCWRIVVAVQIMSKIKSTPSTFFLLMVFAKLSNVPRSYRLRTWGYMPDSSQHIRDTAQLCLAVRNKQNLNNLWLIFEEVQDLTWGTLLERIPKSKK